MGKKHTEEQRRALLDLVASKSTTIRDAAICVGVSYSSATRWVHQSRTEGLSKRPSKALVTKAPTGVRPAFAQLVREVDVASVIYVRVGRAEIAVRRGVDLELLRTVVDALAGDVA